MKMRDAKRVFIIREYERGVRLRVGKWDGILEPGFHTRGPLEEVKIVDMRPQQRDITSNLITKDGLPLEVSTGIMYRSRDLRKLLVDGPKDFLDAVKWLMGSMMTTETSDLSIEEVLERREEVSSRIHVFLEKHLPRWGVDIEAVLINNLCLPQWFISAAEKREQLRAEAQVLELLFQSKEKRLRVERADVEIIIERMKPFLEAYARLLQGLREFAEPIFEKSPRYASLLIPALFAEAQDGDKGDVTREIAEGLKGRVKAMIGAGIIGEEISSLADEIGMHPSTVHTMRQVREALQGMQPYWVDLGNIGSFGNLYEIDRQMDAKLFPSRK